MNYFSFAYESSRYGTNNFYTVPSGLGSADRFGEASQR